jgi:DNA polymerase
MYRVSIQEPDSFEEFRGAARGLLASEIAPDHVAWESGGVADLFGHASPPRGAQVFSVPAGYVDLAQDTICHCDQQRFALLYTLLWRLTHREKTLLLIASDPLVHRLRQMQKSVRRDAHKMTAFVRFRQVEDERGERYVAWFEPDHHILRRLSSFFADRFAATRWSILTPQGSLHWDTQTLTYGPALDKKQAATISKIGGAHIIVRHSIRRGPIPRISALKCRRNIGAIYRKRRSFRKCLQAHGSAPSA